MLRLSRPDGQQLLPRESRKRGRAVSSNESDAEASISDATLVAVDRADDAGVACTRDLTVNTARTGGLI